MFRVAGSTLALVVVLVAVACQSTAFANENYDLYSVRKHRDRVWEEHKLKNEGLKKHKEPAATRVEMEGKLMRGHQKGVPLHAEASAFVGAQPAPFVAPTAFAPTQPVQIPQHGVEVSYRTGHIGSFARQSTLEGTIALRAAWRAWGRLPPSSSHSVEFTAQQVLRAHNEEVGNGREKNIAGDLGIQEGDTGGLERWVEFKRDLQALGPSVVRGINVRNPEQDIFATSAKLFDTHRGKRQGNAVGAPRPAPDPLNVTKLEQACREVLPEEDPAWCFSVLPSEGRPERLYKSCAVVGNGQRILLSEDGDQIDAADAVLRINQAPAGAMAAKHLGTATTFRMINQQWTTAYRRDDKGYLVLEKDAGLILSRTGWQEYLHSAHVITGRRPDVHTRLLSRDAVDAAGTILRQIKARLEELHGMEYLGKGSPSSGFVGTWIMLQMCRKVDVYGVGLGGPVQGVRGDAGNQDGGWRPRGELGSGKGGATSFHYFEAHNYGRSREFGAEPHHSWDLEHDALQVLHGAGYITHHTPEVRDWRVERDLMDEEMERLKNEACDLEITDADGLPNGWVYLKRRCLKDQGKACVGEDGKEEDCDAAPPEEEAAISDKEQARLDRKAKRIAAKEAKAKEAASQEVHKEVFTQAIEKSVKAKTPSEADEEEALEE